MNQHKPSRQNHTSPVMPFNRLSLAAVLTTGVGSVILLVTFFLGEFGGQPDISDAAELSASEMNKAAFTETQSQLPLTAEVIEADVEAPSIPSNLQLVSATLRSVEISWDPSSDRGGSRVEGYQLFRNGQLLQADLPQSAAPGFVDSKVRDKNVYTYEVVAFDTAGNLSTARQITVRTPSADYSPPNIPSNLKVLTSDSASVTLSWDEAIDSESGLSGYLVYRDGKLLERVSEPWFHDSDLSEQTGYTYTISSLDNAEPPNESPKRTVRVVTKPLVDPGR